MVQYAPDVILSMTDKLFAELEILTETVEKLQANLNVYKKMVEDEVSRKTEEVIKNMKILISEIKDLINEKTHFVKDGTKIIKEVEESADEEIQ